jgi:hypothetical protein
VLASGITLVPNLNKICQSTKILGSYDGDYKDYFLGYDVV